MNRKKCLPLAGILILGILLAALSAGCSSPQAKRSLRVLTSFYPVYVEALNVVGGANVTLTNMAAPQTGCLHEYQLTTADRKAIADADVIILNGAGMEAFLDKVLSEQKDLRVIDASAGIPLLDGNAHVWVAPKNAAAQVQNIANGLGEADPENAETYAANARAYIQKLEALDTQTREALAPAAGMPILTFHEAFPYFADTYGLDIVAVVEREPGTSPSPAELTELIDLIRAHPGVALFAEPQYDRTAADILARETGAKVYALDPAVTGPLDDPDAYLNIMRKNAQTMREAMDVPNGA